jgi:hypothetical protein
MPRPFTSISIFLGGIDPAIIHSSGVVELAIFIWWPRRARVGDRYSPCLQSGSKSAPG